MSDLSAFIGHRDPATHRIVAAADDILASMPCYGATGARCHCPTRDRTVWARMQALGLEFLGPQPGEAG